MIDFKELALKLNNQSRNLVPDWLPGGRLIGHEWACADLTGGRGSSLKVNLDKGIWSDFATGIAGGDLISLYAAINNKTQLESAKDLSDVSDLSIADKSYDIKIKYPTKPPTDSVKPDMTHYKLGKPSMTWCYRDKLGYPLFFIARYESSDGKQMLPWSWIEGKWVNKHWESPRPLYGLEKMRPGKPVCLVEGEKACDAARKLIGEHYDVLTWCGGSKAISKVDWTPVYGKRILLWPDADEPGFECNEKIAKKLNDHCPQIKMIQSDRSEGWDAADAQSAGWDSDMVIKWAKPRVKVLKEEVVEKAEPPELIEQVVVKQECSEDMPDISESATSLHLRLGLPQTKQGIPICNLHACRILLNGLDNFKDMFWYDEFHMKYYTTLPRPTNNGKYDKTKREFSNIDNSYLLDFFQSSLGLPRMTDDILYKAVLMFCHANVRNEVKEWFDSLKWDGVKRIDRFFTDCLASRDNEYTRAVGRNFWTSMVARVYKPGCKSDYMVVLEGKQGVGKSEAMKAIGGEWFTEAGANIESKDFHQIMNGNILVEIAELNSFNKAETSRIKSVITTRTDRYRAPYDRKPQDYPRQSIFVGTTNESEWQRDSSGGRRFWPIRCGFVELRKIVENREQLFAEAVVRFKSGADWYKTPQVETLQQQELRREVDEWEHVVENFILRPENLDFVTTLDIAEKALKIEVSKVDVRVQRRISTILHGLGWEKSSTILSGKKMRGWRPKIRSNNELFVEEIQTS